MSPGNEIESYVRHLASEHRRIARTLHVARETICALKNISLAEEAAKLQKVLADLYKELEVHFAEEEGGGVLEEAVSFCPSLVNDLKKVEAEHTNLLAELKSLMALVQTEDNERPSCAAVHSAFFKLCQKLHLHEVAENRILRLAFDGELSGDDDET